MIIPNIFQFLDRPIAFHRVFARIGGSVNAGVFLSQAVYWSKRIPDERGGWFYKTQAEWEDETFLSRKEQETARKSLRESGVLLEDKRGIPAKLFYKIDFDVLQTRMSETGNLYAQNGQPSNISENTSETTIAGPVSPVGEGNNGFQPAPDLQPSKESDGSKPGVVPAEPKKIRPRNELLDTLARLDGANPLKLTPNEGARFGTALKNIKVVTPGVTVEDLLRAARRYQQLHPKWDRPTAMALSGRWSECYVEYVPVEKPGYTEPNGWYEFVNEGMATCPYAKGGERDHCAWSSIPEEHQRWITEGMNNAGCLSYASSTQGAA